jgi:hypothetical protein
VKRLLVSVSLVAITTTAAFAAGTAPVAKPTAKPAVKAPAKSKVAPADEYFGKLKMSILGIRNTIHDVQANIEIDQGRWTGLVNKCDFTEDAVHDWEHKYPKDTWLAKTLLSLERMYAKLDSDEGRKRSVAAMKWLVHDFPASPEGKIGKQELAEGTVGKAPAPVVEVAPSPAASGAPAR